jgi:hypothetical protein
MSEPPSSLDPRVLELLRERPRPPAEARGRVRARLFAAGSASEGGTPSARPPGMGKWPLAGVAFLMGGAAGALLHAMWSQPSHPAVVYLDRPATVASTALLVPAAPALDAPVAVPSPVAPSHAASASSGPSQLAAERALLDEARSALVQGDPSRAIERLQRHRRTFLNPMLAEERDAMEVEALARAGRSAEARARADAFRKRSPDSLFMPTVQSAIESIP